ncbi:TetR/AcrR family transcriptional regulator [Oceanirhabdus seepicola]|uniref:TetR/AcrR family transcriptional regulator n=1 Tax=Oceanirhabdus seepicola TaxID=2828781 RepID=A0A9J6NY91_9CLOT|nr:TetR/AcrR family transcriptional regulator [Oceanirhabdus seepicola]MCM1988865.1 TetR/AcrR family transcriptional regulator [Oceanirhabdus seepicola]
MQNEFSHINISNEKVKRIIIAAFEVFSNNDYAKASTNMIVKKADIPRGVLYHYFKDKEELYNFIFYYSEKIFSENLEKEIDWQDTDYLSRIKSTVVAKANIMSEYPFITEFLAKVYKELPPEKYSSMFRKDNILKEKVLGYNLDFSSLKEDVDIEMFKKIVYYAFESEIKHFIDANGMENLSPKIKEIIQAIDKQIEFFRKHFYK